MAKKKVVYKGTSATQHPRYGVLTPGVNELEEDAADALLKSGLVEAHHEPSSKPKAKIRMSESMSIGAKRTPRETE